MKTATITAALSPASGGVVKSINSLELVNGKVVEFVSNDAIDYVSVVDVSRIADRKALAEEIGYAKAVWTNQVQGVDMKLAQAAFEQAKQFFSTRACFQTNLYEAYNWNYEPAADRDNKHDPPSESVITLWPYDMPEFQETLGGYQAALVGLARRMTRMFALALQLPETAFDGYVETLEASMRILHYPVQTASRDDQNGIGAHTDVEHFTMITQDCDGLDALRKDGQWVKVRPVADSFVVNIADCFMRQTNDTFVNTVHRAINNSGRERYSCPFFFGFNRATVMTPIPSCVSETNPHKYPVTKAGEYYQWRAKRQKERGLGACTTKST
ncbi:hypothetical protein SBRCBS47491_008746 [Sporothrix bragantina]|uniref:Fe2OG dioxygenase domain-containing protein n=1 Tax=Sporothrix bragantina TaxID=671064 RepID=A0ABP0CQH0_9PEZI